MSQLAKILPITFIALATLSSYSFPASWNPVSEDGFVRIPGGTYIVGCDGQGNGCREVNVEDFNISRYEVKFEDWIECSKDGFCQPLRLGERHIELSSALFSTNYSDILSYINWLSSNQDEKFTYAIPSPNEWAVLIAMGNPAWDSDPRNEDYEFDIRPVHKLRADKNGVYGLLNDNREWLHDGHYCFLSLPRTYNVVKVAKIDCDVRSDATSFRITRR